jgi:hypothetical protein
MKPLRPASLIDIQHKDRMDQKRFFGSVLTMIVDPEKCS